MKNFANKNAINIAAFSVVFYIISVFTTFDAYCKTQITPETPLYTIAGLPFLRMDFMLILFSVSFLVGTLLTILLKKALKLFCRYHSAHWVVWLCSFLYLMQTQCS